MAKLFGTDGVRGKAGQFPLDEETVRVIGRSLSGILLEQRGGGSPEIVTGRDTRESGAWLERALAEGARERGSHVRSAGVITTPGVAYLARTLSANAGVVISASHNPFQDNGIKIFAPTGRKLDDTMERRIEADIEREAASTSAATSAVDVEELDSHQSSELRERYLSYLAEDAAAGLSLEGVRLVVDCANGAAFELAPALFKRLGASVSVINASPDGRNINLNCGSQHMDGLRQRVTDEGAHLGVAYDGDADRALFVNARGEMVDGDAVMWAMARFMHGRGELKDGRVVATVMSNIGLEIALRSEGLTLTRTDVGDKYVLEELLRSGACLGGEQSGHIIFPRQSLVGDGMMTTINVLRAMQESGLALDELTRGFERYPQILVNVPVREKRRFEEIERIREASREVEAQLGSRGRLLLRYSGTEALARVMIEGEQQEEIEMLAKQLAEVIRAELGAA